MRTLYLLRPHGTAGLDGEQLVVRSQEEELDRMALPLLDQILVMGKMQLTTQLVRACLRRGIPIAYLSRHGYCLGRLQPMDSGFRHRCRRQAQLSDARRLEAAIVLITGKIANARVVLQRLTRRDGRETVEAALLRLAKLQGHCHLAPDANHLRGLEGSAAALYFRCMGRLLQGNGFGFETRTRRPPLTPFDALCGFGYGVLWNALLLRIELLGLDPYIGVFHIGSQRHAALVSDLIEPLRTFLIDPFHVQLIRAGTISAIEHFHSHAGGTYLNDEGRRLWLNAWTDFMAETITLSDRNQGLRWEVLDQLVSSFARFVDDPQRSLTVPLRR